MNLIDIQVRGNDQKVIPAQMALCDKCKGRTFLILVINGHNHLECTTCGTSFCQGGCDHDKEEKKICKDDSCDQSHCFKCGSYMMGVSLPPGTVCENCTMEEENNQDSCPYCKSGLFDQNGECLKCGL